MVPWLVLDCIAESRGDSDPIREPVTGQSDRQPLSPFRPCQFDLGCVPRTSYLFMFSCGD